MQIPKPMETSTSEVSSQERERPRLRKLQAYFPSQHSGQALRECFQPTTRQLLIWKQSNLGIHIDNNLYWSPHVKSLGKRFSARVKKLIST